MNAGGRDSSKPPPPPEYHAGIRRPAFGAGNLVLWVGIEGAPSKVLPLPQAGELLIGRSPGADLRLDHATISIRHALLRIGPTLAIEDLGSKNGTRVRARKLRPREPVAIRVGQPIRMGSVVAIVKVLSEDVTVPESHLPPHRAKHR